MLKHTVIYYRRTNGRTVLRLSVVVDGSDGWQKRARTVARIVGELHFHLYDLEREDTDAPQV